jgi:Ulp1 family protease
MHPKQSMDMNYTENISKVSNHGLAKKSNNTLEDPGWLNDRIINAYLSLLVKQCDSMGIQCYAFTTQFITKLRSVTLPGKEGEFKKMISRHYRSVSFDLLEVMVIPINVGNGRHWCIIVIDPRKQLIFFYDPLERGVQRVTLLEMIKQYFRELYISRSCNVEINSKIFVTEFETYWEDISNTRRLYILWCLHFNI